jgi:type 1 glutamine amidotransferase
VTKPRALVVTGGIFHDFADSGPALAGLLEGAGFDADHIHGAAAGLDRFAAEPGDLLVLNALAWSMAQNEKYAPYRAEFAYDIPVPVRAAIVAHLARGGGILGLHTAAICFDTWPDWGAILGAGWVWGRSHHPAPGPVAVALTGTAHPITEGLADFTVADELYCALDIAADAQVLAHATTPGVDAPQPVLTAREAGAGRAVWSALGHDTASITAPTHRALLARAARWACRID